MTRLVRVFRGIAPVVALMALVLAAGPASAANRYVRTDGSDTACNGSADAPSGGSSNCAYATIGKAISSSACGDTVYVRPGDYYDAQRSISLTCSSTAPFKLIGDDPLATTWHVGHRRLDPAACSRETGTTNVWRCPIPSGALGTATDAGYFGSACMAQKLSGELFMRDADTGTSGDVRDWLCLTAHTSNTALDTTPGTWTVSGSNYLLHLWNSVGPTSDPVIPPSSEATNYADSTGCLNVPGAFNTFENLTIVSGCGVGMSLGGDDMTLRNVRLFNGLFFAFDSADRLTLDKVTIANNLRRPGGTTLGPTVKDAWRRTNQSAIVRAHSFTVTDFEAYAAREGVAFSQDSGPGTINRAKIHWHWNHNYKFIDNAHDIDAYNVWAYNSGSGGSSLVMYNEGCIENIKHVNSTFAEAILIHANYNASCTNHATNGPMNIDFFNCVFTEVEWMQSFGDARAGARGHDFDYNTYLTDIGHHWIHAHHPSGNDFTSLPSWQNWAGDTCTNCVRDPNSNTSTSTAEFVQWKWRDDTWPRPYNFDLKTGARAIDRGDPNRRPPGNVDMAMVTRVGNPDAGAWENEGSGTPNTAPAPPENNRRTDVR